MGSQAELSGPDLAVGISESDLAEGQPLLGHAGGEAVVLVREHGQVHALGATCTHYGGPLAEGTVYDGAIHCPWHHACFDLATGRAHGPAMSPIACYDVALVGGKLRVGAKRDVKTAPVDGPKHVVIVGGGAAGVACAEALRAHGSTATITIVSGEGSDPVDRPNLSKDYLAGAAPEEWVFTRTAGQLAENRIELVAQTATAIDTGNRVVKTATKDHGYDALLVATGAEPIRLPIDGANLPHVHTLRSLADSRAIAAAATGKGRVAIIGASFIGLEVAAALRARGVAVTVIGPETVPLARVLGDEVGAFIRGVHEAKGVAFELGRKPAKITPDRVILDDGREVAAEVVVMGVGVRPRTDLAGAAGLKLDRGVVVDAEMRAAPNVWAAGDIARFPYDGELVRVEHWQVAVRQGQAAARSMLGRGGKTADVPFFWSQHHDVTIGYVGHAERFDRAEVVGKLDARDAHVVYREGPRVRAVATIGRDKLALQVEAAFAHGAHTAVVKLVSSK
jgi:NADPH-dependent 2,4-dienoyl-CoA reductase/sulfur reductase-like enzyme/nitrite reductase/ring-hydroxylating ferredoxin subunit